ncbi:MAG: hypothetical protein ACH34V_09210 [Flavobacterium sp.]|uniref:hypothetical protein n=1 Tax=Flavobacterium sp. TaxID=239 RepID=UPI0037962086
MLTQKRKKKNPDSKEKDEKEKARIKQLAEFIAKKGVTKVESSRRAIPTIKDTHARCQECGSWINDSNEYEHYDWCSTLKRSRRNPVSISKTKSAKYDRDLIQLDLSKKPKYRDQVFLTYKGKEIEFTGEDAEDLRDIMREQLKVFRGSSRLQKLYSGNLDNSGGYDTFITEQLKKIYPKVFR